MHNRTFYNKQRKHLFGVILGLLSTLFVFLSYAANTENEHVTISFDTYWAACQVAKEGETPYNQEILASKMTTAGISWNPALNYYNPPWFLFAICKFTQSNPETSFHLYQFFCVIALLGAFSNQ